MIPWTLTLAFLFTLYLPRSSCTAQPQTLPNNAKDEPKKQALPGAVLIVGVVGGTVIAFGMGWSLWLVYRKVRKTSATPILPTYKDPPSPFHSTTTVASSAQPEVTTLRKGQGKSLITNQPLDIMTPPLFPSREAVNFEIPGTISEMPSPVEPLRIMKKDKRPKSLGLNQGKSVGGIYELPASPRRIMISTPRGDECRHTWEGVEVPRDSRNKKLPEVPGEARNWI